MLDTLGFAVAVIASRNEKFIGKERDLFWMGDQHTSSAAGVNGKRLKWFSVH